MCVSVCIMLWTQPAHIIRRWSWRRCSLWVHWADVASHKCSQKERGWSPGWARDSAEDKGGLRAMKGRTFVSSASHQKMETVSQSKPAETKHKRGEKQRMCQWEQQWGDTRGPNSVDLLCKGGIRSRSAYQSNQNGREVSSSGKYKTDRIHSLITQKFFLCHTQTHENSSWLKCFYWQQPFPFNKMPPSSWSKGFFFFFYIYELQQGVCDHHPDCGRILTVALKLTETRRILGRVTDKLTQREANREGREQWLEWLALIYLEQQAVREWDGRRDKKWVSSVAEAVRWWRLACRWVIIQL